MPDESLSDTESSRWCERLYRISVRYLNFVVQFSLTLCDSGPKSEQPLDGFFIWVDLIVKILESHTLTSS